MISITFALLASTSIDAFSINRPAVIARKSSILSMSTKASEGSAEALAKARSSVDDIAQIREGRTVELAKYRNIGIMVNSF
jgi:DNA-binding transcriptional regulator YiaG